MKLIDYSNAIKQRRYNHKNIDELRTAYYKKCFELFDSTKNNSEELEKIAEEELISAQTIRNHAWNYAIYTLGYSDKEWYEKYQLPVVLKGTQKRKQNIRLTPTNSLYLALIEEENPENIIKLIKNANNVNLEYLRERISNFVVSYFPEEKNYLIESLKKKVDLYVEYLREQNRLETENLKLKEEKNKEILEKQQYAKMKVLLENFIKGNYENKHQFCTIHSIIPEQFETIIEFSKKYDISTYQEYEQVIISQKRNRFAIIVETIKKMIYYIESGIESENNTTRPFDIIDYYLLIKIDFDKILKILNEGYLSSQEIRILKIFISKNKNNIKNKTHEIIKILEPSSVQIIANRIIEQEEKKFIIDFLRKNKIPENANTYSIALKRYLNNTLPIEEQKGKTRCLREIK